MQLKIGIKDAIPPRRRSLAAQYRIFAVCNKCSGMHDMGATVLLKEGPIEKQSIGQVYKIGVFQKA
jgi:hypothetical protein